MKCELVSAYEDRCENRHAKQLVLFYYSPTLLLSVRSVFLLSL